METFQERQRNFYDSRERERDGGVIAVEEEEALFVKFVARPN